MQGQDTVAEVGSDGIVRERMPSVWSWDSCGLLSASFSPYYCLRVAGGDCRG